MQLDIFNDSRDVMLRNDLLQALQTQQVAPTVVALNKLRHDHPEDPALANGQVLLEALQTRVNSFSANGFSQHVDLRCHRLALLETLAPAAQRMLGASAAQTWLRPFWQDLVARSKALPFCAAAEQDHAAWLLLQLQDWPACADVVAQIESWRRIPAPLSWMVQAKLQSSGLPLAWPLLAELAWLAPQRLPALAAAVTAPQLNRLMDQFESAWDDIDTAAACQDESKKIAASADNTRAWAWFPAWVLTTAPQHAPDLTLAQPGQHKPPEQAFRLLVNLLGLEHQGRHHELVKLRKDLRNLHAGLYAAYMSTR